MPELFSSQILVFFDEDYFNNFFKRNSEYQIWELLPQSRDLVNEWKLKKPDGLKVRGYKEIIRDESPEGSYTYEWELWFVGEL